MAILLRLIKIVILLQSLKEARMTNTRTKTPGGSRTMRTNCRPDIRSKATLTDPIKICDILGTFLLVPISEIGR